MPTLHAVTAILLAAVGPALAGFALLRARREARLVDVIRPAALDEDLLVLIPARNERARLPPTLQALLQEPSPRLRVLVIDDGSDDGTADVARAAGDPRVAVLRIDEPLPAGVFGKPRALALGEQASGHGALVLCLDADVVTTPGLCGGLVRALRAADVAALSGVPRLDNRSFVEEALVPAFVAAVAVTHPPSRVHDERDATAFLNGQLLLVRRDALRDVGGFFAVQDTVLEDVGLARALKRRGHRVRIVDVRALAATRMYESFSALVRGFKKNARALHGRKLVPLALVLPLAPLSPFVAGVVAAGTASVVDDVVAVVAVALTLGAAMANRALLGSPPVFGVLSPIVQIVVGVTYLWAALSRRETWRGRIVTTR